MATIIYDKAKWHYQGDWPKGLRTRQAFVHTGMFLTWIVWNDLMSEGMAREFAEEVALVKAKRMKGADLLDRIGGSLIDEDLNDEGNRFAQAYFDFERGKFLADYESLLAAELPSIYHPRDTWKNFELLRRRIDQRYAKWRASRTSSAAGRVKTRKAKAKTRKRRKATKRRAT